MLLEWLTFVSATLAAVFQGRRAVQGWLYDQWDRRDARRAELAGWSRGGVDTWIVRLADLADQSDPSVRTAVVAVTICDRDGRPSPDQADRLRCYLKDHQYLSRNPTSEELEAVEQASKESGRLAITRPRRNRLGWRRSHQAGR
jgi:hypothetical protein